MDYREARWAIRELAELVDLVRCRDCRVVAAICPDEIVERCSRRHVPRRRASRVPTPTMITAAAIARNNDLLFIGAPGILKAIVVRAEWFAFNRRNSISSIPAKSDLMGKPTIKPRVEVPRCR